MSAPLQADVLRAEVLREFGGGPGGLRGLDYGSWSVERRVSQAQKARDRAKLVSDVDVARRAETARRAPPRPCVACGKPIAAVPHKRGPKPRWCSPRCYARWYARGRANICGKPAAVPCETCGAPVPRPTHQRGPAKRFCGPRCQARAAAARRRAA